MQEEATIEDDDNNSMIDSSSAIDQDHSIVTAVRSAQGSGPPSSSASRKLYVGENDGGVQGFRESASRRSARGSSRGSSMPKSRVEDKPRSRQLTSGNDGLSGSDPTSPSRRGRRTSSPLKSRQSNVGGSSGPDVMDAAHGLRAQRRFSGYRRWSAGGGQVLLHLSMSSWNLHKWRSGYLENLPEVKGVGSLSTENVKLLADMPVDKREHRGRHKTLALRIPVVRKEMGTNHQVQERLADLLKRVGCYFGADPDDVKVADSNEREEYEENGFLITKITGLYYGNSLYLLYKLPFYDPRIPPPEREEVANIEGGYGASIPSGMGESHSSKVLVQELGDVPQDQLPEFEEEVADLEPELDDHVATRDFSKHVLEIESEEMWQEILSDRPWSQPVKRVKVLSQLNALAKSKVADGRLDAMHGIWELAVNKDHHKDFMTPTCEALSNGIVDEALEVQKAALAGAWMVAVSQTQRRKLRACEAVTRAMSLLATLSKVKVCTPDEEGRMPKPDNKCTMLMADRDALQENCLGVLGLFAIDKACREMIAKANPSLSHLFSLCMDLLDYKEPWRSLRRKRAAYIIASMLVRDADIRVRILQQNVIKRVLESLRVSGPGSVDVWVAMSAVLRMYVCDDDAMQDLSDGGQVLSMFEESLASLHAFLAKFEDPDSELSNLEAAIMFKVCQYTSQAIWGSAYFANQSHNAGLKEKNIQELALLSIRTQFQQNQPKWRRLGILWWHVTYGLTAAIATFAMNEQMTDMLVGKKNPLEIDADGPAAAILDLVRNQTELVWKHRDLGAAQVMVAALTGVVYLTLHPIGTVGEESMKGIYRKRLLRAGAFPTLLAAMEAPMVDEAVSRTINKSCSVGLMYLATVAEDEIDAKQVMRLLLLIEVTRVPEVVEHLMVGLWVLMRNPHLAQEMRGFNQDQATKIKNDVFLDDLQDMTEIEQDYHDEEARSRRGSLAGSTSRALEVEEDEGAGKHRRASLGRDVSNKPILEDQPMLEGGGEVTSLGGADDAGSAQASSRPISRQVGLDDRASTAGTMESDEGDRQRTRKKKKKKLPHERTMEDVEAERLEQLNKSNWGLQVLLRVADTWLDKVEHMDEERSEENMCLLKMVEFMVACFWLYLVGENMILPRRRNVSEMDAPKGVTTDTWWTVQLPQAMERLEDLPAKSRSLEVLLRVMSFQHTRLHAKSVQLSAGGLWNLCMRSHAVEVRVMQAGVVPKLLAIVNNDIWPAPTRDTAAAFLGELTEEWSNAEQIGSDGIKAIHDGLLHLASTRTPRLQACALRVLGHMTFDTPKSCPNPKAFMMRTKSNLVEGDCIGIICRIISRYLQKLLLSSEGYGIDAEDIPVDIDALPEAEVGKLPIIAHGLRVLLNISVCDQYQVKMAKVALQTLMRMNCLFTQLIEHGNFLALEREVANLTNGIVSNLATHPHNRTRFYKLELQGTAIAAVTAPGGMELPELKNPLGRMELASQAGEVQANVHPAEAQAYALPKSKRRSTSTTHLPLIRSSSEGVANSGKNSAADKSKGKLVVRTDSGSPSPKKAGKAKVLESASPSKVNTRTSTKNVLGIKQRLLGSPRGRSSGSRSPPRSSSPPVEPLHRPKVVFPPLPSNVIEAAASGSHSDMGAWQAMEASRHVQGSHEDNVLEDDLLTSVARLKSQSKKEFLQWMHSTFTDPFTERALQRVVGRLPPAVAKLMPKKNDTQIPDQDNRVGPSREWKDPARAALSNYHVNMRRPLNHLWTLPDEMGQVSGQARWEPAVSEYLSSSHQAEMSEVAGKLLVTQPPQYARADLKLAVAQLEEYSGPDIPPADHPEAKPLPETVKCLRPPTRGVLALGGRENGRLALVTFQEQELELQEEEDGAPTTTGITLGVKLAPQRPRTFITFFSDQYMRDSKKRPKLTMFEKVEGSKVSQDIMPHYQLPNGKQAHFYFTSTLVDEKEVLLRQPPMRPNTLQAALQHTIPLDVVLSDIAKPPGSGPNIETFKPAPPLAPLPRRHFLRVKDNVSLKRAAFGDLKVDTMEFVIVCEQETRTETRIFKEPIRVKTPWSLPVSVFKPRMKDSDAKDFYDDNSLLNKMFIRDWEWLEKKDKFIGMLHRENKSNPAKLSPEEAVQQVRAMVEKNYDKIQSAFEYYAAMGSGSPFHIQLNSYTTFLEDCSIPDPDSQGIKRSDCDTVFIVANYLQDKKGKLYEVNDEHALMRFEFIEMLVRISMAKYGKEVGNPDPVVAMDNLFQRNFLPNIPEIALLDVNVFRKNRLYNEQVDAVYKKHAVVLKAIYSRYRLIPKNGGLRKKVMYMDGWMEMMDATGMIDESFTILEARLCYLWSRMRVVKEIDEYERYTAHTYVDFLEAIGRLADMKMIPTDKELADAGYTDRHTWMKDERNSPTPLIPRRPSAHINGQSQRPLHEKIEGLLEIIFRALWYDGTNSGQEFNYDGLAGYMNKLDKQLGP